MSVLSPTIVSFDVEIYEKIFTWNKKRRGIIITLQDSEGSIGKGEIAPFKGRSLETFDESLSQVMKLKDTFFDKDRVPFALYPSVMFGMEMAMHDVQKSSSNADVEITTLLMHPPKKPPFGPLKLKLGNLDIDEAADFFNKCKSKEQNIRIDLERKWGLDKTIDFCKQVDASKIVYIEDPTTNYSDLERFYIETNIPYAIDNFLTFQPPEVLKILKGLKSIVVKPSLIGGLSHCTILKELFSPIDIVISSLYESEVGIHHLKTISSILSSQPAGIDTLKLFVP